MKTLIVLAILIALVGLGIWNSPNEQPSGVWVKYSDVALSGDVIADQYFRLYTDGRVEHD